MVEPLKEFSFDKDAITEATEVGPVLHFLCEDVDRFDLAFNMMGDDALVLDVFSDLVFPQVEVLDALGCQGLVPVDAALVIVLHVRGIVSVGKAQVDCLVSDREEVMGSFVVRVNLRLAGAEGRLFLED